MPFESNTDCNLSADCLLQNVSDAVISTDLNFIIRSFNAAAEIIYGIHHDDAIGRYLGELIQYDFQDDGFSDALETLNRKGSWSGEVKYQHPNGTAVYLMATVKYVQDCKGRRVGIVAVNKDITTMRTEKARRENAEFHMQAILENSGQGLILMDKECNILLYNAMAQSIHQELVNCTLTTERNLIEILPYSRRKEVSLYFKRVRDGEKVNYEIQYGKKWMEVTIVPIPGTNSKCEEICACLKDISSFVRAEQKRTRQKQRHHNDVTTAFILGQENERKQIGRELHDNINQLLAAIKLKLALAITDSSFRLKGLDQSHLNIQHAINEVRKLSHQLLPPEFGNGCFVESIQYLILNFTPSFNVFLDINDFDSNRCSDAIKLNLYRILQEQLNNIYKYAVARKVVITLSTNRKHVNMQIKDDGVGTVLNTHNKGVGLTNIGNRVSSLNGKCFIWSRPGKGFRLNIEIPYQKVPGLRHRSGKSRPAKPLDHARTSYS